MDHPFRTSAFFRGRGIKNLPNLPTDSSTGKSVSEAPILESVDPEYGKRVFIEFPGKYKFRTCCVQTLF